ncbi:hypothetical protein NONI108955_02630 [Nocardia ninae]|uniref:Mce-associated membrane protein n=1 Tax=Nocardia ninae NBRC 108245 TaxID=1210091 RepID=A0A511MM63_9NOCA|nr:hypothetical protein [Nocardia ninae]GEM41712.1 hypothetical protein NN4_62310 [Nocardia ninae NBRC 108245]
MTSRKPINRVTSKRRPAGDQQSRAAAPRSTPSRKPRVTGTTRPTTPRQAPAAQQPEQGKRVRARRKLGRGSGKSGRSFWSLVAACLIAAVLLGGFAAVAASRPGVDDSNKAFVDNKATEEVRAAADHALKTVYAYDVKNIDGYRDTARQVLTGKMLADLDKYADTTISAVKQAQTSADAKAEPIGVTLLTDDRAELLVNLVVSATKNGAAQQSVAGPVVLHMQKVGDRWLASDIVDQ